MKKSKEPKLVDPNGYCKPLSHGKVKGRHQWEVLDTVQTWVDEYNLHENITMYCKYCNEIYGDLIILNYGLVDLLAEQNINVNVIFIDPEEKE